jgi:hypothetical protein
VNNGENAASSVISDWDRQQGIGKHQRESVPSGVSGYPRRAGPHGQRAAHPTSEPRNAVTARITAGWPRFGKPLIRHNGQYCNVAALQPGHCEPAPILRLRYQDSPDQRAIGIYKTSTGQYSESELPGSLGPMTCTSGQGINETFILYTGPRTTS